MAERDPNERVIIERALSVATTIVESIPEADIDVAPPVDRLADVQVVAYGFWLLCGDLTAMLRVAGKWPPEQQRCGWCIGAAGDDQAAFEAAQEYTLAEVRAHAKVCPHNPLVRELAEAREQLAELHRRATRLANRTQAPGDWACVECHPHSDMLIAGFRCDVHALRAASSKEQDHG